VAEPDTIERCARVADRLARKYSLAATANRLEIKLLKRTKNTRSGENRSAVEHHQALWGHFTDKADAARQIAAYIRLLKPPKRR